MLKTHFTRHYFHVILVTIDCNCLHQKAAAFSQNARRGNNRTIVCDKLAETAEHYEAVEADISLRRQESELNVDSARWP